VGTLAAAMVCGEKRSDLGDSPNSNSKAKKKTSYIGTLTCSSIRFTIKLNVPGQFELSGDWWQYIRPQIFVFEEG
jgi:hypothetical protein